VLRHHIFGIFKVVFGRCLHDQRVAIYASPVVVYYVVVVYGRCKYESPVEKYCM
jgi:hypothetical protein